MNVSRICKNCGAFSEAVQLLLTEMEASSERVSAAWLEIERLRDQLRNAMETGQGYFVRAMKAEPENSRLRQTLELILGNFDAGYPLRAANVEEYRKALQSRQDTARAYVDSVIDAKVGPSPAEQLSAQSEHVSAGKPEYDCRPQDPEPDSHAAVDAFRDWERTHSRENYGRCDAFVAGIAWATERAEPESAE